MIRPQSEATKLKNALNQVNRLKKQLQISNNMVGLYRQRVDKAEAEVVEWKNRFDVLLRREPKQEITGPLAPINPTITC